MSSSVITKTYTFASPFRQNFSLPFYITNYFLNQPKSARNLLKLYQSCKHFFSKRPILCILDDARYDGNSNISAKTPCAWKKLTFKSPKIPLWFDKYIIFYNVSSISNIFRCTVKELNFHKTTLLISEFSKLVEENTIYHFYVDCSPAHYSDGTKVSMNIILQMLPNIVKLYYYDESEKFSTQTLKKCVQIQFKNKFHFFGFTLMHEDFDEEMLTEFITKNVAHKTDLYFRAGPNISAEKRASFKILLNSTLKNDKNFRIMGNL